MAKTGRHEDEIGVEQEIGGTAGQTHDEVLLRTLGRERGLDVATRRGPPPPRRR